ncbi:MerR family transcriptional regulator [Kitasatospora purpeofusca]|uniref:MerR family transcriptional regulator n=1 Tax=Kitasatospora purpeofusca TaxID=67352 RepID=UPI0035DF4F4C
MREQDELLTIGRFARLCRLSVKQLRHYDDTGLLPPTRVDPATGYRYYAADRARDALTVALLRELDVPLAVIAATLAGDEPDRARLLRAERDRVAERITRDRARLELLERLADGGGLPGYEVAADREPERRLAVVRAVAGPAGLGERVGECVGRLLAQLDGVAWRPPLWGLFPLDLGEGMRIAVGAEAPPLPAGSEAPSLPAGSEAPSLPAGSEAPSLPAGPEAPSLPAGPEAPERLVLPGGPVLAVVHHGSYAQLPLAYHALLAAVHERGLRPVPPVREAYLVGPGEAAAEEWMTRLVVRVEERVEGGS